MNRPSVRTRHNCPWHHPPICFARNLAPPQPLGQDLLGSVEPLRITPAHRGGILWLHFVVHHATAGLGMLAKTANRPASFFLSLANQVSGSSHRTAVRCPPNTSSPPSIYALRLRERNLAIPSGSLQCVNSNHHRFPKHPFVATPHTHQDR